MNAPDKPLTSRLRILVAGAAVGDAAWADWQAAKQASAHAARIALQRVTRGGDAAITVSAGIGYGQTLRWFGPVDSAERRRQLIAHAGAILDAGTFIEARDELAALQLGRPSEQAAAEVEAVDGLFVLSHAETDLLALERARGDLPADFPRLRTASLLQNASAERLLALFGEKRAASLLAIVRLHGSFDSVPGLAELVALAHREGWALVVISGIGGGELLPRTAGIKAEFAANITSYFMAGGVANVTQALRYAAAEHGGLALDYAPPQPMPAHGLYHPDLLLTTVAEWEEQRDAQAPVAIVVFYRAHVLSNNLEFVDVMLRALEARGFAAVGVFTSSLRDRGADGVPVALDLLPAFPDVIVNTVNFPVFNQNALVRSASGVDTRALETVGAPLLQAICCGTSRAVWQASARGLSTTEAAINIALPECDARVIGVPISFKEQHRYVPDVERIGRLAGLARRMAVLRRKSNADKRIAVVLSNAGGKAQRIGGAVGMDTPASLLRWLQALQAAGYDVGELPTDAEALMQALLAQGCYDEKLPMQEAAGRLSRQQYCQWFRAQSPGFQQSLRQTWGEPNAEGPTIAPPFWRGDKQSNLRAPLLLLQEPFTDDGDYLFSGLRFGKLLIAIQPPRGFGFDAEMISHSPDLPPCHHYAAFYRWLDQGWRADALVHFGTHGTLEWLPGKSMALSADCAPDVLLGELPLIYPFIINNPGEGAQAKRRTHAVIIDHLVPPLTQADSYGPLSALTRLVEEYYRAEAMDSAKLPVLRRQIWEMVRTAKLEDDLKLIRSERHGDHVHEWDERTDEHGVPLALERLSGRGFAHLLEDLDTYLCELGRKQIRGGLHVFGEPPSGTALIDLLFAILRSPNADLPSLVETLARVCGIDPAQLREAQGVWTPPLAPLLVVVLGTVPVTVSQLRRALDELAREWLIEMAALEFAPVPMQAETLTRFGSQSGEPDAALADLLRIAQFIASTLAPDLARTRDETRHLLGALNGAYVPAGASGSPTRGMAHVLPTGRNFYTVDPRSLPTAAAWSVGSALAREALKRHVAERGHWPQSIALSIWGTPTLRNGGDDIAQALALLGVRPLWETQTRAAQGVEVIPLAELGRPRIDVTLRVSGFFRDAFPALMQLFDDAVQRVVRLDESPEQNYVRKHWLEEAGLLQQQGRDETAAQRLASYRVFSSKPGAYGTGLMELVDSGDWRSERDLAEVMVQRGSWAYSPECSDGVEAVESFRRKLAGIELVLQNQDNSEQDLFDSSDYFEFHGGLVAAVKAESGSAPAAYVGDAADPVHPAVRTLQSEALRVYRSRIVNPKWLQAMQRHGYRGGLEMAATMDSLFGYAATAGIVSDWMFEGVAEHFTQGQGREFLQAHNPWALNAIAERLLEAEQRQLWNAEAATLEQLRATLLDSEACIEDAAGHF